MLERRPQDFTTGHPVAGALRAADVQAIAPEIRTLAAASAEANPHATPAALLAASTRSGAETIAMAARDPAGTLIGLWPLIPMRRLPGPLLLSSPVPRFDVMGQPALAPGREREALARLLDAIILSRKPRQILVDCAPDDGPFRAALEALASEGVVSMHRLRTWQRSVLARDAGQPALALSSRRLKRLHQKRRAIEGLAVIIDHDPIAIAAGLDQFVALEAAGWKGRAGTALANQPANHAHLRATLLGMAATGDALTARLMAGERCLAVGLLPVVGSTAFFWKTAYDDAAARLSPGVLLDLILTEQLAEMPRIRLLDTATSADVDPASQIWAGRRTMATLLIDLTPGGWRAPVLTLGWRLRERARALRHRLRG